MTTALVQAIEPLHRQAEQHPLMSHLMSRSASRQAYYDYLSGLYPIYAVMESVLPNSNHPLCQLFARPALYRAQSIQQDIHWLAVEVPQLAREHRVSQLAKLLPDAPVCLMTEPACLAAMAYVRYLGDLAGGQAMARALRRSIGINEQHGGRFFDFALSGATAGDVFSEIRQALALELQASAGSDAFTHHAVAAFEWHITLFDAVWAYQTAPFAEE